jgi:hypothetical protein
MRYLAAAATAALVIGCGSGPRLVPVSGTVLLNGEPLEGATVLFSPDVTNPGGQPGVVVTGPGGKYQAMTRDRPGLVPGKYKVGVTKTPAPDLSKVPEELKNDLYMARALTERDDPAKQKAGTAAGTVQGEFDREIPPEGGEIDFDVKK